MPIHAISPDRPNGRARARPQRRYPTVFLTDRGELHQKEALAAAPKELDVTMLRDPPRERLFEHLKHAEFLISERSGRITREMIQSAPNLRMILRLGSRTHDIDLDAARDRGIIVCAEPVLVAMLVAEHVMLQILALGRRLRETSAAAMMLPSREVRRTDEDTFSYNWTERAGLDGLVDRTIGVLGLGEVGVELALRLRGFRTKILYVDLDPLPESMEVLFGARLAARDVVFSQSDYVVNLLPYSDRTDRSIGHKELALMKHGAFFVSAGSGGVVVESAVAECLKSGKLGGAAFDTFEYEPLPADNPLRRLLEERPETNLLLTPHVAAGAPSDPFRGSREEDYLPIVKFLRGEPLTNNVT